MEYGKKYTVHRSEDGISESIGTLFTDVSGKTRANFYDRIVWRKYHRARYFPMELLPFHFRSIFV